MKHYVNTEHLVLYRQGTHRRHSLFYQDAQHTCAWTWQPQYPIPPGCWPCHVPGPTLPLSYYMTLSGYDAVNVPSLGTFHKGGT